MQFRPRHGTTVFTNAGLPSVKLRVTPRAGATLRPGGAGLAPARARDSPGRPLVPTGGGRIFLEKGGTSPAGAGVPPAGGGASVATFCKNFPVFCNLASAIPMSFMRADALLATKNQKSIHSTRTMIKPYYPEDKASQAAWWQNAGENAATQLALVGFSAPDIAAVKNDADWAVYLLRTLPDTFTLATTRVTGYAASYLEGPKDGPAPAIPAMPAWPAAPASAIVTGIESRRADWVRRAKGHPKYDPATIGEVLRLEPTGEQFDPTTYRAVLLDLECTAANTVIFKFRKASGEIDGIHLYLRRKGETAFTFVKFFSRSPGTDLTPVKVPGTPEERDYQARAVLADAEVGLPSDILNVLVRG
jgi:hypothetical protein